MTTIGAVLAAIAISSLVLAARSPTNVRRSLQLLAPDPTSRRSPFRSAGTRELRDAGVLLGPDAFLLLRVASAGAGVFFMATAALFISIGPALVLIAGYLGWISPSLVVARRAARSRAMAERATIVLVERIDALVATGRPAETALARVLERPTGAALLDRLLERTREAYTLGAPLFRTLAQHAREEGLEGCAALAQDLERTRDMGSASAAILRERRSALRSAERSRALDAASKVEGRLMLVLALCYLPALMLLVVIPLFMSLLDGLAV